MLPALFCIVNEPSLPLSGLLFPLTSLVIIIDFILSQLPIRKEKIVPPPQKGQLISSEWVLDSPTLTSILDHFTKCIEIDDIYLHNKK